MAERGSFLSLPQDGDGFSSNYNPECVGVYADSTLGTDCADDPNARFLPTMLTASDVNPSATEICDGIDNNCNGRIDHDNPDVVALDSSGVRVNPQAVAFLNAVQFPGNAIPARFQTIDERTAANDNFPDLDNDGYSDMSANGSFAECSAVYSAAQIAVDCRDDPRQNSESREIDAASINPDAFEIPCNNVRFSRFVVVAPSLLVCRWMSNQFLDLCVQIDDNCDAVRSGESGPFENNVNGVGTANATPLADAQVEVCDGIDQDCDNVSDNGFVVRVSNGCFEFEDGFSRADCVQSDLRAVGDGGTLDVSRYTDDCSLFSSTSSTTPTSTSSTTTMQPSTSTSTSTSTSNSPSAVTPTTSSTSAASTTASVSTTTGQTNSTAATTEASSTSNKITTTARNAEPAPIPGGEAGQPVPGDVVPPQAQSDIVLIVAAAIGGTVLCALIGGITVCCVVRRVDSKANDAAAGTELADRATNYVSAEYGRMDEFQSARFEGDDKYNRDFVAANTGDPDSHYAAATANANDGNYATSMRQFTAGNAESDPTSHYEATIDRDRPYTGPPVTIVDGPYAATIEQFAGENTDDDPNKHYSGVVEAHYTTNFSPATNSDIDPDSHYIEP